MTPTEGAAAGFEPALNGPEIKDEAKALWSPTGKVVLILAGGTPDGLRAARHGGFAETMPLSGRAISAGTAASAAAR